MKSIVMARAHRGQTEADCGRRHFAFDLTPSLLATSPTTPENSQTTSGMDHLRPPTATQPVHREEVRVARPRAHHWPC